MWRFEPATFTSAVCYANHSATQTCYTMDIKNKTKIASESNQKFYKCSFWAAYTVAESTVHCTVIYSSVVAGWNAAQKDIGSILIKSLFLFFYFILEGYWFKSSEHSKSLNSVNTNKKILHLSSLLQYNYLTKN